VAICERSRLWSSAAFGTLKTYSPLTVLVTMNRPLSPGGRKLRLLVTRVGLCRPTPRPGADVRLMPSWTRSRDRPQRQLDLGTAERSDDGGPKRRALMRFTIERFRGNPLRASSLPFSIGRKIERLRELVRPRPAI
jgi:hypothetical protein